MRRLPAVVVLGMLVLACTAASAAGQGVIGNGTVQLGVNATGDLNYDCFEAGCPEPSAENFETVVGLRYQPLNLDSTSPGCQCEGWGVGDLASGLAGYSNQSSGTANLEPVSFTASLDGTSAVAVVDVVDPSIEGYRLRVTHDYHPAPQTPHLYADVVTVENTGDNAITDLLYRRNMDWDIEPTAFNEWVTSKGTSPQLRFNSDDGFADSNPLTERTYIESEAICGAGYTGSCEYTDLGSGGEYTADGVPSDHGGLYDFGFGALPVGETKRFTTYYGAAATETAALTALTQGGAQVYSLGQSDCPNGGDVAGCSEMAAGAGPLQGTPATFMFGFVTTSGDLQISQTDSPDPVSVGQSTTYTLTVLNNGPDSAAAVQVVNTLPTGDVTVGTITPSSGTCTAPAAGEFTCSLGDMPNGSTRTITVQVSKATGGSMTNSATVSSPSEDANPGNNTASATTTVQSGTLAIDDVTVTEPAAGTTTATFTITRSGDTSGGASVDFTTGAGGATPATAGADYTATSGTVAFAAAETSKTVDVSVLADALDEDSETYLVTLSNPTNVGISDGSGLGTINDDDPPPVVSIADQSVAEGDSGTTSLTFTVSLDAPSGRAVSVSYATSDGTATAPGDYATASGTVSLAAGETSKTFTVGVVGDTVVEADETLTATLSAPQNATLGDATATGTILNDDSSLSIDDVTLAEPVGGPANATFTITRTGDTTGASSVAFATGPGGAAPATAGADYTATSGTANFGAGETTETVDVPVLPDALDEASETYLVTLSAPTNAVIGDGSGLGTITDDDPPPAVSVSDQSVAEGNSGTTALTFTVSLDAPSGRAVSVGYATSDGTAVAPGDYATGSGTVSLAAGETTKTFSVGVAGDTFVEADETLTATLSAPENATLGDATATGTIVNDDSTTSVVVPVVSAGNVTVDPEGDSGTKDAVFSVTLSQATTVGVSVAFATADGTASEPADYGGVAGTLNFAAGQTAKTVAVPIKGDLLVEPDETLTLRLSNPSGATLGTAQGTGTIVDDDEPPPDSDVPGSVDDNDLFCGAQHRGACKGLKFKAEFTTAGNASWVFDAYNPAPGKGKASSAAAKRLRLGTVKRAVKAPGVVKGSFKLKGRKADRLLRKVKKARYRKIRVTLRFTEAGGRTQSVRRSVRLR